MTSLDILPPVVHYQFGCNQDNGQIEVVKSGPFLTTLVVYPHHPLTNNNTDASMSYTPPLCHLSSNGMVSSTVVQSNATIQELQTQLWMENSPRGLAMEVWMTPLPTTSSSNKTGVGSSSTMSSLPILTFATPSDTNRNRTRSYPGDDDGITDCAGLEVALAQRGLELELRYIDYYPWNSGTQQVCRVMLLRQQELVPYTLQQVLVVWLEGETNVYLNGVAVIQGAENNFDATTLSHWDPSTRLELFGRSDLPEQQHFEGSLNMVSIYDQVLTELDVAALYQKGKTLLQTTSSHRTPLTIDVLESPMVQISAQGETGAVNINGSDFEFAAASETTGPGDWSLRVEITSLPQYGSLYTLEIRDEGSRIHKQDRLVLHDLDSNLTIWYHPNSQDFFNAPSYSFNGSRLDSHREFFTYRLLVVPTTHEESTSPQSFLNPLAASQIVEQLIMVVHVNHQPKLQVPKQLVVAKQQPQGVGARPLAYLDSVQVLDEADFNIDQIRVDLWAYNGTLTILNDYLALADFSTCRASERLALLGSGAVSWSCHGTGVANRNMTFVAIPGDVSEILSHVEYQGFYWNQEDEVVIRLYDGVGGSCLSQNEHRMVHYPNGSSSKYHTIHNGECFEVMATIPVPPIPSVKESAGSGGYLKSRFDFGHFGVADCIFWGVILLLLTACCVSIRACIRCFGARGAKIHVEDDNVMAGGEDIV